MIPQPVLTGIAAAVVAAGVVVLVRRWMGGRITPEEAERLRRGEIVRDGKLGDCEVLDVEELLVTYSYQVAGVGYTVSQDVGVLGSLLPDDHMTLVGPATVKYLPRNPANSIVLAESWNGLRTRGVP